VAHIVIPSIQKAEIWRIMASSGKRFKETSHKIGYMCYYTSAIPATYKAIGKRIRV
jgi:hypothetical protein